MTESIEQTESSHTAVATFAAGGAEQVLSSSLQCLDSHNGPRLLLGLCLCLAVADGGPPSQELTQTGCIWRSPIGATDNVCAHNFAAAPSSTALTFHAH